MHYEEAMAYIHSVNWLGSRPGLERISVLCEKLGHPEENLRFIHVGGTNGKGSFCCMLQSVLTAAGYKTGLFTSPYIERFNERMQIDGEDISDRELADLTETVKAAADTMADPPTEFELITALSFLYFRNHHCDIVVLEVGLGGRLDSTNIIPAPVLAVITGIDYDHTALLGDTTAKIAGEKAGIIKPHCPVLFGEGDPEAEQVIRDKTESVCGDGFYRRTDYSKIHTVQLSLAGSVFSYGEYKNLTVPLLGLYQLRNAANVLTAIDILRQPGIGMHISETAVRVGLEKAYWPARFEKLSGDPLVFYDGAHNPQGIRGACANIRQYLSPLYPDGRIVLCMGVLRDKDFGTMIGELASLTEAVFTVTPDNPRALTATETAAEFTRQGVPATAGETLADGVEKAVRYAKITGRPLVILGSLYMYGDVKKAMQSL